MKESNFFSRKELTEILNSVKDKTLGEVDTNNVFDKTKDKPKITGIAGDVIEQSVLGYPPDSAQRPDLNIDGVPVELKTTGIRKKKVKKNSKKQDSESGLYEAKEPASITAVSIGTIEDEDFYSSSFWQKIARTLFVFYEYESDKPVNAAEYANFHIRDFCFHSFEGEDLEVIKSDWQLAHDFLKNIRDTLTAEEAKKEYPNLSTIINKKMAYLDTAPKYPNPPRFRLRRRVVSSIIQETFEKKEFEKLPDQYKSYSDVIHKCSELTKLYNGLSLYELALYFGIASSPDDKNGKQMAEQIVVKMFGGQSKKISDIELFNKFGILGKTITLNKKGGRTEDMKIFSVNFDDLMEMEIIDEDTGLTRPKEFEDSELYSDLTDNKMLCVIFQEVPDEDGKVYLGNNIFKGFKFYDLSSEEILSEAKKSWEQAHRLIIYDKLKVEQKYTKDGKLRITPKTKLPVDAPNLPKSADYMVFFRGTGGDARDKILINNCRMYKQNYWIKGKFIVEKLANEPQIPASNSHKLDIERNRIIEAIKQINK